ncbi:MAG: HNH endonuclease signature motif containing protein, partial [Polyangiaceae bacterium]
PRAKQTTRPAHRRTAIQRDQRRCRVPGCCNATFVDVHHITARADGGGDNVANLIVLCAAHHRAVHRGQLVIEGTTAEELRFRHADGSHYGEAVSPAAVDVQTKVFKGLCGLGFRDGEVRRVLDGLRRESGAAQVTAEQLLRKALERLTSSK